MKKLLKIKAACAATALWYVAGGVDEEAILRLSLAHGFTTKDGMADEDWLKVAALLGIKTRATLAEPILLGKFIKKHAVGLYLVGTFDHLFVVDNGIIFDPRGKKPPGLKRKLHQAWKVVVERKRPLDKAE